MSACGEGPLRQYLDSWGLSAPRLLTGTPTSNVYRVARAGMSVVLKIFKPMGVKDEAGGASALRAFDGHGAVRLLAEDKGAQLLEYAGRDDLISLVKQGRDEQAAMILADVMNQLHGARDEPPPEWNLSGSRRRTPASEGRPRQPPTEQ